MSKTKLILGVGASAEFIISTILTGEAIWQHLNQ